MAYLLPLDLLRDLRRPASVLGWVVALRLVVALVLVVVSAPAWGAGCALVWAFGAAAAAAAAVMAVAVAVWRGGTDAAEWLSMPW
jgi:hypothetical protein